MTDPAKVRRRTGWLRRLFADVFYVARTEKNWWMLPLLVLLLVLAALLAFAALAGPLAPFLYPVL